VLKLQPRRRIQPDRSSEPKGSQEPTNQQKGTVKPTPKGGGFGLDTNRLNTSHSQRLNSGKPLDTGRCDWWCPIDPCL